MHKRVVVMMGRLPQSLFDMVWTPMGALVPRFAPSLGTIQKAWRLKAGVMLCWIVCLLLPASAFAHSSHQLYRQAKATTVLIVGIDDDTQSLSFGSGVFVSGDGLVLTNAHVIKDATRLFVYSQAQDVDTQPEILAVEPDWDLAALRVAAPRPTPYLSIAKEQAEELKRMAEEERAAHEAHARQMNDPPTSSTAVVDPNQYEVSDAVHSDPAADEPAPVSRAAITDDLAAGDHAPSSEDAPRADDHTEPSGEALASTDVPPSSDVPAPDTPSPDTPRKDDDRV